MCLSGLFIKFQVNQFAYKEYLFVFFWSQSSAQNHINLSHPQKYWNTTAFLKPLETLET